MGFYSQGLKGKGPAEWKFRSGARTRAEKDQGEGLAEARDRKKPCPRCHDEGVVVRKGARWSN